MLRPYGGMYGYIQRITKVEVSNQITYSLPRTNYTGHRVSERCDIKTQENNGKGIVYQLVAWGKMAKTCMRKIVTRKKIICIGNPHSYSGYLFNKYGDTVMDTKGDPVIVDKSGFTIERILDYQPKYSCEIRIRDNRPLMSFLLREME